MMKKKTVIDWIVLGIVVVIALVIITLSFSNTAKLAGVLKLNPYLTAGLVEILFGSLLFIRGRQRALQRNVPLFLSAGYFTSLAFVTAVNMWGLAQINLVIGLIVGLVISASMWLMETTLVWLWNHSNEPHRKTIRDRLREAKQEIAEEKACQQIEWMKYEATKPDLQLIVKARKAEQRRKKIIEDGLPEFFQNYQPRETIVISPANEITPGQEAQVVPMKTIGFQIDEPREKAGVPSVSQALVSRERQEETRKTKVAEEYIQRAMEVAEELLAQGQKIGEDFGRNTLAKKAGVTPHYSKIALQRIREKLRAAAND